jgi:hypothetical protein
MKKRQMTDRLQCNPHPDAPHGFMRDASHSAGRYVCECESWEPKQEPVAWMFVNEDGECEQIEYGPVFDDPGVTPLYAAPPKREWVGLTDHEVWEAIDYVLEGGGWLDVARVLEQAFKEKNNG